MRRIILLLVLITVAAFVLIGCHAMEEAPDPETAATFW